MCSCAAQYVCKMNARNAVAIRISAKLVGADLIFDSIENSVIVTISYPRNDRRQEADGFRWRRRRQREARETNAESVLYVNFGRISCRNARRGLGLQNTRVQGCQQHGKQANDVGETRVRHGVVCAEVTVGTVLQTGCKWLQLPVAGSKSTADLNILAARSRAGSPTKFGGLQREERI
jgi:hypothetical protein